MKQLVKKFASRKFLVSLVSTICGVLGMMNVADDTIGLVGSMLMIIIPNVMYIITEGSIDRESVKNMVNSIADLLNEKNADSDYENTADAKEKR